MAYLVGTRLFESSSLLTYLQMHNSGEEERDARWSPDDPKGQECPNRGEPIGMERVYSVRDGPVRPFTTTIRRIFQGEGSCQTF